MSDYSDLELQEQLMNQLEEMQTEIDQKNQTIADLQNEVSKKDLLICEALDKAEQMSQQSASLSELQELTSLVQEQKNEILKKSETIKSLNVKIGKLAESDNVLMQNKELNKQNNLLKQEKQNAEQTAMTSIKAVKAEYASKIRILEASQKSADQAITEAKNLKSQLSQEAEARAEHKIKDKIAMLQTQYKAKETALVSYVAIFGVLTATVTILSLIRQKTFLDDFRTFWIGFWNILVFMFKGVLKGITYVSSLCDKIPQHIVAVIAYWIVFIGLFFGLGALLFFGVKKLIELSTEPIVNGISAWNCSISVIALVAVVYFGDYIKNLIKFNLFGIWIILTIILIGVGIYLMSGRTNRGYY